MLPIKINHLSCHSHAKSPYTCMNWKSANCPLKILTEITEANLFQLAVNINFKPNIESFGVKEINSRHVSKIIISEFISKFGRKDCVWCQ